MRRRATALLWVAPPFLGSCASVEVPNGPDLSGIAEVYDQPTGVVDRETFSAVVAAALLDLEIVQGLGQLEFITDSLEDVSDTIHDVAADSENSVWSIRGSANVRTICPGGAADPTSDPANGDVEYTIAYEHSRLEDTVWGTIDDCSFYDTGSRSLNDGVTPGPVHYDGTMNIYLGEQVELKNLSFPSFLFRLDGRTRLGSIDTDLGMDFRILQDGKVVEVRVPATDGDVVFGFGSDATRVQLRSRDAAYCCDFDARVCSLVDGDSCDDPTLPGQDLTW